MEQKLLNVFSLVILSLTSCKNRPLDGNRASFVKDKGNGSEQTEPEIFLTGSAGSKSILVDIRNQEGKRLFMLLGEFADRSTRNYELIKAYMAEGRSLDGTNTLSNSGTLHIGFYARSSEELILAGIPVSGSLSWGAFDSGIWFDNLRIADIPCSGGLDYNSITGSYTVSNTYFGRHKIEGADPTYPSRVITSTGSIYIGGGLQKYAWNMKFGRLLISGPVYRHYDDPNASFDVTIPGTRHNGLRITRADGSLLRFSRGTEAETIDEIDLRYFLAFLEVIGFEL